MKRIWILLLFLWPTWSQAQYSDNYFEVGLASGVSSYSGELTSSIFDSEHLHLGMGAFVRYNIGGWVSLKAHYNYGTISGDDKNSSNEGNRLRNLHFRSRLHEVGLNGEFNLLGFHPRALERKFSPYVFIGISLYNFNPEAQHPDPRLDGEWVALQPIRTEGQGSNEYPNRDPYALTQVAMPLGLGLKLAINSAWTIGLEVGLRKTFTDYLDDVSLTYAVDENNNYIYDRYSDPYDPSSTNPNLQRPTAEIFADRTPELYEDGSVPNNTLDLRGRIQRGDDNTFDWFMFSMLTVSYNFIDNGLAGSRKRRKRRSGCRGAQF